MKLGFQNLDSEEVDEAKQLLRIELQKFDAWIPILGFCASACYNGCMEILCCRNVKLGFCSLSVDADATKQVWTCHGGLMLLKHKA